jgi:riboflavin synthase
MFTGIVEEIGTVAAITQTGAGHRLRVETSLAGALKAGDSIAVNGVCLTVVTRDERGFHADIGAETARITNLGRLQRGRGVNLERAMRADDRLGGHFVLGHVDAVGALESMRAEAESRWLRIGFPEALAPFFIRKGAVAVDGVSLTIAALDARHFDVQVIPYTWEHTAFKALAAGDPVNLECDMIGKYVVRALQHSDAVRKPA